MFLHKPCVCCRTQVFCSRRTCKATGSQQHSSPHKTAGVTAPERLSSAEVGWILSAFFRDCSNTQLGTSEVQAKQQAFSGCKMCWQKNSEAGSTGKCNDATFPLIDEHVIHVIHVLHVIHVIHVTLLELASIKRSNFGGNAFDHGQEAGWQLRWNAVQPERWANQWPNQSPLRACWASTKSEKI